MAPDPVCRQHFVDGSYPVRGDEVRKQVVHYSCLRARVDHTVVATTAGWTGQRTARETNNMAYSLSAPAGTADAPDEPILQAYSEARSVGPASIEFLITEQEVLLGTAAVARAQRQNVRRSERPARPRRAERPKRYEFLERALMAREMGRL
jgi:hypothetical protein